jgi:hypothetical protein
MDMDVDTTASDRFDPNNNNNNSNARRGPRRRY